MNLFYIEIIKIGYLLLFSLFLSTLLLFISIQVSVSNPNVEKLSAYECGFDPYEDSRNSFEIRFYLVAILFIIFDLEAIYFFPWCISISYLPVESFWFMLDFFIELIVGFIYAWKVGALEWE